MADNYTDLTDAELQEELDAELKQRAIDEGLEAAAHIERIDQMVKAMTSVLSQMGAENSEALGAAFTLTSRFIRTAISLDPDSAKDLQAMSLKLLMVSADPRPIDANIQLTGVPDGELIDDEAPETKG